MKKLITYIILMQLTMMLLVPSILGEDNDVGYTYYSNNDITIKSSFNIQNINGNDDFELDTFASKELLWTNSNIGKTPLGWSTTEVVTKDSIIDSWFPSISVDSTGTVHVIWSEHTNYGGSGLDDDIFYKSKPKGGSWTATEVVSTESTEDSWLPSISIDSDDTIHVTWEDWTDLEGAGNDWDIFYKCKPLDGSWATTEIVSSESTDDSGKPSLATDYKGAIHIVWEDVTDITGSGIDCDIFYKFKESGGNWSTTEVVSTESNLLSWLSKIDIDNNKTVHVTWVDATDVEKPDDLINDLDIFYKYKLGEPGPHLEIHSISGGFGVSTEIKNIGDTEATNVEWTLKVTGGIFGQINKEKIGSQHILGIDKELIVRSGIIFGLGKISVIVTVICDNSPSNYEQVSGTQILFFSFI